MFNIYIAEENSKEVLEEAYELAKNHYYEVEEKASSIPFAMDVDMLGQLVDAGIMFVVTARLEGELIGYFANLVTPDFMTSQLSCKELAIYVDPTFRREGVMENMLARVEKIAKERGALTQLLAFKKGHGEEIAPKLGYDLTETVYQKVLGE